MTTDRGSAKIYSSLHGSLRCGGQHEATEPAATAALPRDAKVVSGSGWYHDEAIQAERSRKNCKRR